jgi:ribosomal protein S18 acetylase RimI-like enzyme
MEVSIRRASPSDLDLALEAVGDVHGRRPVDERALRSFLSDPSRHLWLALSPSGSPERVVGSLNGYSLLHPHRPDPQYLLYELDVRPSWRGQGIGRSLVSAFVSDARRSGAFEVWVPTDASNLPALSVYSSCGFLRRRLDDVLLSVAL